MSYINTKTLQYPLSETDVKNLFPNVAFPAQFVPPDEFKVVFPTPQPAHDASTKAVREIKPAKTSKGTWEQRWEVYDLPSDTVLANMQAKLDSLRSTIVSSTQKRLDDFAKTRGYDDVNSIAKYKDIKDSEISALPVRERALVQKFVSECRYLSMAAARTWAVLYIILADVEAGKRRAPAGYSEVEAELPELVWPGA